MQYPFNLFGLGLLVLMVMSYRRSQSVAGMVPAAVIAASLPAMWPLIDLGIVKGRGRPQVTPVREYGWVEILALSVPPFVLWFAGALLAGWTASLVVNRIEAAVRHGGQHRRGPWAP